MGKCFIISKISLHKAYKILLKGLSSLSFITLKIIKKSAHVQCTIQVIYNSYHMYHDLVNEVIPIYIFCSVVPIDILTNPFCSNKNILFGNATENLRARLYCMSGFRVSLSLFGGDKIGFEWHRWEVCIVVELRYRGNVRLLQMRSLLNR